MCSVKRPFDLLLFDLDGTLIDSLPQIAKAVNLALVESALAPVSLEVVRNSIGNGADKLVERALKSQGANSVPFDIVFSAYGRHYAAELTQELELYSGVKESLARFKQQGYQLAIVTNKPSRFIAPILKALDIEHYFSLTLGGNCVENKKPSAEPLLQACRQLNIDPSRALMIGDSKNDILAAKAAGIKSVGLTYGYNYGIPIKDSQPDWVCSDFFELESILDLQPVAF